MRPVLSAVLRAGCAMALGHILASSASGELLPGGLLQSPRVRNCCLQGRPGANCQRRDHRHECHWRAARTGRTFHGVSANVAGIKDGGFNAVRVDWIDKTLEDAGAMAQLDEFVGACSAQVLKVIFDNHNNEATEADWENAAQQKNGLWFDTGPGTDGTDGSARRGTVSAEMFQQDWVAFARHWTGNSTVIGFDLRNEPCAHTTTPAVWGGNGPRDIHAMYERVGNAVLATNPDALIICEAVIDYKTGAYEGDLSIARTLPVRLSNPVKLVYSVHEYPKEIGAYPGPESGPGCRLREFPMFA